MDSVASVTPGEIAICKFNEIGEFAGSGPWKTWYFGRDYGRLLELAAALRDGELVPVGEAVNAVAARMRQDFVDLDAHLASGRFRLSWLASDMAERNPYTSDFVLDICRVTALIETARQGGRHLVVVDDRRLGRAVARCCRRAGFAVRWRAERRALLYDVRGGLRHHADFLRDWNRQRRALARNRCPAAALAKREPLLLSWADGTGLPDPGVTMTSRFFGRMPAWLREAGLAIGWLDHPLESVRSFEQIAAAVARAAAFEPRTLLSQFWRTGALLRAYGRLLALPFALRRRFELAGIDLTPLVHLARTRELTSSRLVRAAMYSGLAAALARNGVTPRAIIYTYENQPWEKAMLAGFRRVRPATRLIGVQHAPIAAGYIGCHPSRRQWHDGTMPDLVVTIGEEFRERLLGLEAPADRVVEGGALRYPDLLAQQAMPARDGEGPRYVLAACSMDANESLELSQKAVAATAGLDGLRLVITLHPWVSADFRAQLRKRIGELTDCRHVELADGGTAKWLPAADILLYDSSSTVYEATALGVPAIYVASMSGLDLDVMEGANVAKCRSVTDLRRMIARLLKEPCLRKSCVDAARASLVRCFGEPRRDLWTRLACEAVGAKPASCG
jgi:surface carbohydrate biosynthesis protein (TIGR04326 family)